MDEAVQKEDEEQGRPLNPESKEGNSLRQIC